jgi:hypothetical protein
MIADTLQENLSWRGDRAYFRKKMPDGRERWKTLGLLSKDDARRAVKHMLQKLTIEDLEKKLGILGRSSYAKIGAVITAYDLYTAGIQIDPLTVRGNKAALRRILAVVQGEKFDVDGADTSLLTRALLQDYSAAMIAERKQSGLEQAWDPEELKVQLQRAQRTIGSTVQQARSVFSAAALESTAYRSLELPDLKPFLEAKVGEGTVVRYVPPPLQVLDRISADARDLKEEDPTMWLALMLMVNGGCRRNSAVEAKWEWFVEGLDRDQQPMVELDVRVAKGGNSLVRFDWGLYQEMKALRSDLSPYIVPGRDTMTAALEERVSSLERSRAAAALIAEARAELALACQKARQNVFTRLVQWLRKRGLDERRAPNHELRKWYIDQKFSQHGATEAQNAAGHHDGKLTSKVYSQRRTQHSLRVM